MAVKTNLAKQEIVFVAENGKVELKYSFKYI